MRNSIPLAAVLLALALTVPVLALAKTTGWIGSVSYGSKGSFEVQFEVKNHTVTYWLMQYGCTPQASPGDINFPTKARIKNGKFKFNYTARTSDAGFHAVITGRIVRRKASGTIDVLNDPDLGGSCSYGTKHWHAHKAS
jgi:hypothetical protein